MVEAIAQLGVVVVCSDERFAGKLPLFGGVDKARFRRQVSPGDVLDLEIELERLTGRGGRGLGRATVDGEIAAEARLMFVVVCFPIVLPDEDCLRCRNRSRCHCRLW